MHTNRQCIYTIPKLQEYLDTFTSSSDLLEAILNCEELLSSTTSTGSVTTNTTNTTTTTTTTSINNNNNNTTIMTEYSLPVEKDHLHRELILTQPTTILGISKFELKLLKFYDYQCISMFSYGHNQEIHNTWKYKVPHLFIQSQLVRNSIFALASMVLQSTITPAFNDSLQIAQIQNNLFNSTLEYFLDVLNQTKSIINGCPKTIDFQNVTTAKELTVSSTILFTILAINPNRLLPLISFDKSQSDFISISKGVVMIIAKASPIVFGSDLIGIIYYGTLNGVNPPNLNNPTFPIIKNLINDLNNNNNNSNNNIYDYSSSTYELLYESLDILNKGMYATQSFEFPVPFFRWINLISDDFRQLLYDQDEFALRLLFVFSSLCLYAGFSLNDEFNIWKDFIDWYKHDQEGKYNGQFKYLMDGKLYQLIIVEKKRCNKFKEFPELDVN